MTVERTPAMVESLARELPSLPPAASRFRAPGLDHFPFLSLPFEIRQRIYHYALASPLPVIPHRGPAKIPTPGLLLVSKQVQLEAYTVLYGENVFNVLGLRKKVKPGVRALVRRVARVVKPRAGNGGDASVEEAWRVLEAGAQGWIIHLSRMLPQSWNTIRLYWFIQTATTGHLFS